MRIQFAVAFSFLALNAIGQIAPPPPEVVFGNFTGLINEPFSADAITTLVRTLPDGTHITRQTMTVKMYRDSAGRSRSDRIPGKFLVGQPAPPPTILIRDPLAGYSYVLDTVNKIANRSAMPKLQSGQPMNLPAAAATPAAAQAPNDSQPTTKVEDLGMQTMEGLTVQGRRITITYPAGSLGNDRDIANVAEIWSNSELRLMILQVRSDPRNGETTTKLENLSRTQPDPNLFLPPPDYKIVDVSTGHLANQ